MAEDEPKDESQGRDDGGDGGLLSDNSTLALVAVVVLGAAGGGMAGTQVIAPMFGGGPSQASAAEDTEAGEHGSGGEDGSHGTSTGRHEIGNLVVNPAESGGSRFLMITLSLEVEPGSAAESLAEQDAQVRDLLNRILGSKTAEELSDIDRREEIKAEIRKSLNGILEEGEVKTVYTPQYVLQ